MASNKILVIDDSRVIRKTVRDMLPDGDFDVIEAKDGVEGINLVGSEHPSLIMLDFILPKMSGWEVFQQIQAHPELQKIPLVLMSGKKEEVTSKISEPFEFFEFIEKPFDRVILAEAIRSAMTKARKARPRPVGMPGATQSAGDIGASTEIIDRLQSQIADSREEIIQLRRSSTSEILALQGQLLSIEGLRQADIQNFNNKFATLQQSKTPEDRSLLNKVSELETEIDILKKQLGQLVVLIKKRLT